MICILFGDPLDGVKIDVPDNTRSGDVLHVTVPITPMVLHKENLYPAETPVAKSVLYEVVFVDHHKYDPELETKAYAILLT